MYVLTILGSVCISFAVEVKWNFSQGRTSGFSSVLVLNKHFSISDSINVLLHHSLGEVDCSEVVIRESVTVSMLVTFSRDHNVMLLFCKYGICSDLHFTNKTKFLLLPKVFLCLWKFALWAKTCCSAIADQAVTFLESMSYVGNGFHKLVGWNAVPDLSITLQH